MNIVRKGRQYSDTPIFGGAGGDNYGIVRVSLRVARGGSDGRWEAHDHSRNLLLRLDTFGLDGGLEIKAMVIGGRSVHRLLVRALDLYLKGCKGLTSFRRDNLIWGTRPCLMSLLSKVGFPPSYNVTRPQSSNQVHNRLADERGLGAARELSPDRRERGISERGHAPMGSADCDDTTQESFLGSGRSARVSGERTR